MKSTIKASILLLPFLMVFSIFILELVLLIISFFGFYIMFKKRDFSYFQNSIFLIVFCFSSYLFISNLLIYEIKIGQNYSFFYIRYILYIICLSYLLNYLQLKTKFLFSFLLLNLILVLDSICQFIFGFNLIGFKTIDTSRISSFFGDELILGGYLLRTTPLIIALPFLLLENKKFLNHKKIINYFLPIIITLNLIIILISGERTALFLYILFCFYLFIFLQIKFKFKIIYLLSIITIGLIVTISNENIYERIVKKTYFELFGHNDFTKNYYGVDEIITKNYFKNECQKENKNNLSQKCKNEKKFYIFSPTHHNYYLTSINIFLDNKYFGSGPKSFRVLCLDEKYKINIYSCSTHTHNYYVQLISETGVIGLILIIILLINFVYLFIKILIKQNVTSNHKNYYIVLIGGLLINFFPFVPTGNFFNNWLSIMIYIPLSFLITKNIYAFRI